MLLENLPHVATAKKRKRTKDAMGGFTDSFTTVFSDRACWVQPASDREVNWWQQRSIGISHRIFFASDPGLDETHVIERGGWRYEVRSKADPDDSVGLGVLWRVMVEREGST